MPLAKGNGGDARLRHVVTVRPGEAHPGRGEIEAHRSSVAAQHLEIRSGAAAAIENARRRHAGRRRAPARASCIAGIRETRSAIAPLGTSAQVGDPRTKVCDRHATIRPHMRFRGLRPQRAQSARWGPGLAETTLVVIAAVVIACLFTYPYIINFSNAGRLDTNDGRWSIWVVSWVAHALTTDPGAIFRANIFYPHDNALAFSEGNFVGGAMAAPAWLLTQNPYAAHNFFFIAAFVLSSVATYYLVRYLTGDWRAAVMAGLMYAYCPFAFVRQAHSQLLLIGFLPWAMLAFHRFIDRVSVARAIELGIVLWLTGLACAYYGIFAGGMVGLGTLIFAITRGLWKQPRYWALVALAAVVCIGLMAPFFLPYLRMQDTTGFARPLDGSYSANFAAWLISSAWAHRWWAPYLSDASEVLFPGIMATVLGIWGRSSGATKMWRGFTSPPPSSRFGRPSVPRPASTLCSITRFRCFRSFARHRERELS